MLPRYWRLFVTVATVAIGLIIWSSTLSPKRPRITLESIRMNNWNVSRGLDERGVPTGLLTSRSTVVLRVTNADSFWGYNINGFVTMNVFLRQIATTKIKHFYEPRKTTSRVIIELRTNGTPLYGASPTAASNNGVFYLVFEGVIQTEAGFLPFMYKYTFTNIVSCKLTGFSVGPGYNLALASSQKSCPRVVIKW